LRFVFNRTQADDLLPELNSAGMAAKCRCSHNCHFSILYINPAS
jgi:hypothetical protein